MCVSTERAMSRWLIDEYEKGRLSGGSWSFSYQPNEQLIQGFAENFPWYFLAVKREIVLTGSELQIPDIPLSVLFLPG
jgi:hypothetical protein